VKMRSLLGLALLSLSGIPRVSPASGSPAVKTPVMVGSPVRKNWSNRGKRRGSVVCDRRKARNRVRVRAMRRRKAGC
jgi:hypothetical protein